MFIFVSYWVGLSRQISMDYTLGEFIGWAKLELYIRKVNINASVLKWPYRGIIAWLYASHVDLKMSFIWEILVYIRREEFDIFYTFKILFVKNSMIVTDIDIFDIHFSSFINWPV